MLTMTSIWLFVVVLEPRTPTSTSSKSSRFCWPSKSRPKQRKKKRRAMHAHMHFTTSTFYALQENRGRSSPKGKGDRRRQGQRIPWTAKTKNTPIWNTLNRQMLSTYDIKKVMHQCWLEPMGQWIVQIPLFFWI